MLHFIPAWYQENNWCENEQYWYSRRTRTEFDDTVKHIQLFHRRKPYPFQIMLLSFAPNFRHFLHRQSVFHAPYWSCFDAIQEIRRKKVMMFSFHNLNWPEHVEFIYSPYVLVAMLKGKKYAQVEFGEDGNPIQVDIYQNEMLQRRNIYDDRGFVSSTMLFENQKPLYQDYLNDKGVWKIREFWTDGHVEVNKKCPTYLLEYEGKEYIREFSKTVYEGMEQVIFEVLTSYLALLDKDDLFCVAMHELNTQVLSHVLKEKKTIISFYGNRYRVKKNSEDTKIVLNADYIITDSQENLKLLRRETQKEIENIVDITPFDSRVDFGISQQLNVQKVMVPVDGMDEETFEALIKTLGEYLPANDNVRIHLFTRVADYDRKAKLLAKTRACLRKAGMEEGWAAESNDNVSENTLDNPDTIPVRFFVEQCVDELAVSKCMREQRLIVDMRKKTELYLRITGISVGIPQIVYKTTEFVENGQNGLVVRNMSKLGEAISFYLDNITNWNEAMVYSYELGKKYTTEVLVDKWREVIEFVGCNSDFTTGK